MMALEGGCGEEEGGEVVRGKQKEQQNAALTRPRLHAHAAMITQNAAGCQKRRM
jgi:hypothetical protein